MSNTLDNRWAWALCAPACIAMVVLNILPGLQTLLLNLGDAAVLTAVTSTTARAALLISGVLAIEAPLAVFAALSIIKRERLAKRVGRSTVPLVIGALVWWATLGNFLGGDDDAHVSYFAFLPLEICRTLPLATLFFFQFLRKAGNEIHDAAKTDVHSSITRFGSLYLPLCRPVIVGLLLLHLFAFGRSDVALGWFISLPAALAIARSLSPAAKPA